jgi:hypothetical protein
MSQTQIAADPAQVSPARIHAVVELARALLGAARNWKMYAAERESLAP